MLNMDTTNTTANHSVFLPMPMVQAAIATLMECAAFAIDDVKDEKDEDEDFGDHTPDRGDNVMDEVGRVSPPLYSCRLEHQ